MKICLLRDMARQVPRAHNDFNNHKKNQTEVVVQAEQQAKKVDCPSKKGINLKKRYPQSYKIIEISKTAPNK